MKKVILFMAYFGKLPTYFPVWLKAIEFNSTIDFCLITDCIESNCSLPQNVKLANLSFEEFKDKVQRKFPFKIKIHNYGRVSQFRPAFAYIFEELVKGYDNWGYIECDLIPGDIRSFLTEDILERYDKCFKLGHFQVFKNNEAMNTLFMRKTRRALNYKFAFQHNVIYFEEVIGVHNICVAENVSVWDKRVFSDIDCRHYYFQRSDFAYEGESTEKCIFVYDNGKLFQIKINEQGNLEKEECLYVHLQKRSMEITSKNLAQYIIVPNEFSEYVTIDEKLFNHVVSEAQIKDVEYSRQFAEKEKLNRKKKISNVDWWLFYIIRLRLRKMGCIGLSGKTGVL